MAVNSRQHSVLSRAMIIYLCPGGTRKLNIRRFSPRTPQDRHFDISSDDVWLCNALLFFICCCPLLAQTPLHVQAQRMTQQQHHSCSKGALLLATVIGPSPSGPEFLHIHHTAAKLCRLEALKQDLTVVRVPSIGTA